MLASSTTSGSQLQEVGGRVSSGAGMKLDAVEWLKATFGRTSTAGREPEKSTRDRKVAEHLPSSPRYSGMELQYLLVAAEFCGWNRRREGEL